MTRKQLMIICLVSFSLFSFLLFLYSGCYKTPGLNPEPDPDPLAREEAFHRSFGYLVERTNFNGKVILVVTVPSKASRSNKLVNPVNTK